MPHRTSHTIRWSLAIISALGLASISRGQLADPPSEGEPTPVLQPEPAPQPPPQPAAEADPVDAGLRAKLKLTIDSYAQAKSLSFRSKVTYSGLLEGKSPATESTVRMTRPLENPAAWLIRATGSGKRKPTDTAIEFDMLWGPQSIYPPAKKLFERPAGQGRGLAVQMAAGSVPTQITERIPFSKENVAESMTLDSAEPVGGVPCELLTIRPKGKHSSIKLWIGVDDHLLRKVERVSESSSYGSSTIIELTDLKIDEGITPESLAITLPDGFERDSAVVPTPKPTPSTSEVQRPVVGPDGTPHSRPGGSSIVAPGTTPAPGVSPSTQSHADPEANPTPSNPASTIGDPQPATPGLPPLPAFSAMASDGTRLTNESIRGQPSVLFFFGSWSLASRAAAPVLSKAIEDVKSATPLANVRVFAFAVRERSKDPAADFVGSSHPAAVVTRGDEAATALGVRVYPTFLVVNADGKIQARLEGFRRDATPDQLTKAFKALFGLEIPPDKAPDTPTAQPTPTPAPGPTSNVEIDRE